MAYLVLKRILYAVPILFLLSIGTFSLLYISPGDLATSLLGEDATPERVADLRHELGLDRNPVEQYASWLGNVSHGDLGRSYRSSDGVNHLIMQRIQPTLWLGLGALIISIVISVPLGVFLAAFYRTPVDSVGSTVVALGAAIPEFLLGIVLVFFISVQVHVFPSSGYVDPLKDPGEGLRHLALPWISLSAVHVAAMTRMIRARTLDVLSEDYIRTARSKGLAERTILYRHALRNGLLSSITLIGLSFRQIIGGAVIVEYLFAIPGMGRLLADSVLAKDFLVVQGIVLYVGVGVVMINLLVDLTYTYLDPRVRYS